MPNNYVIVGPNDEADGLPTFWNNEVWGWVDFEQATRFNSNILRAYPLPQGGKYILDVRTINTSWLTFTPSPVEGTENHPVDVLIRDYEEHQPLMEKIRKMLADFRKSFDKQ